MKLKKLCEAFKSGKNAIMRRKWKVDEIVSRRIDGFLESEWFYRGKLIAKLFDGKLYGLDYYKILDVWSLFMYPSRINYILKRCFNTPVSYHLKYDRFRGNPIYGYFKIGSNTYETPFIVIYFDENYNVVKVDVSEVTRVIYAMNDGKVKYLVKLAKTLHGKLEELKDMLELIPSEKRDDVHEFYLNAVDFITKTCLIDNKLCVYRVNYDDVESIKRELKRLLNETDVMLKDVKKHRAEKTLFPE